MKSLEATDTAGGTLPPSTPHATDADATTLPPGRLTRKDITRAIRTRQWAKNALLFAGFLFAGLLRPSAAHKLGLSQTDAGVRVFLAFICFCALSACAYLINDWKDVERDRLHPVKRHRPLASGRLSMRGAMVLFGVMALIAFVSGGLVALNPASRWFVPSALAYLGLTLSYSLYIKHEVILDVIWLALGFVVRVVAGCLAVPVPISPWIVFCTFMLALLVSLCKRRAELLEMGEARGQTRRVLDAYTPSVLDTCISVAAGLTLTSYSLYTFSAKESSALAPDVKGAPLPLLMLTIPFVVYGVFRFLLLAGSSPVGGEPEQMLRDKRLVLNAFLWALTVALLTILQ